MVLFVIFTCYRKKANDDIHIKEGSIVWNIHSVLNVLSSRVISSDEISTFGWWMDHVKFDSDIRCFNQRWALCSKVISNILSIVNYSITKFVNIII